MYTLSYVSEGYAGLDEFNLKKIVTKQYAQNVKFS